MTIFLQRALLLIYERIWRLMLDALDAHQQQLQFWTFFVDEFINCYLHVAHARESLPSLNLATELAFCSLIYLNFASSHFSRAFDRGHRVSTVIAVSVCVWIPWTSTITNNSNCRSSFVNLYYLIWSHLCGRSDSCSHVMTRYVRAFPSFSFGRQGKSILVVCITHFILFNCCHLESLQQSWKGSIWSSFSRVWENVSVKVSRVAPF